MSLLYKAGNHASKGSEVQIMRAWLTHFAMRGVSHFFFLFISGRHGTEREKREKRWRAGRLWCETWERASERFHAIKCPPKVIISHTLQEPRIWLMWAPDAAGQGSSANASCQGLSLPPPWHSHRHTPSTSIAAVSKGRATALNEMTSE